MKEALKIAGIPHKERDFRLSMYEFIRMNLWYYLESPTGSPTAGNNTRSEV